MMKGGGVEGGVMRGGNDEGGEEGGGVMRHTLYIHIHP